MMTPEALDKLHDQKFWRHRGLLLVIVLAGFGLRVYRLGAQSLWYDETVSAFLAGLSPTELVLHTARDIHPPGYYLALHYWVQLVGDSEFALAYFSLTFGVVLIALTYALARQLTNPAVAGWAALLVAISPFQVWYAQEVRMYTLAAALGVIVVLCLIRAASVTSPAARRYWIGYLLAAVLGLYVLYYFAFLLLAVNLFFVGYALYPKFKWTLFKPLMISNGLVLLLFFPWLPVAWGQATNPPVPPWRMPPALVSMALESWSALSLGQSVEPAVIWPVLLSTLLLFGLGTWVLHSLSPVGTPAQPDSDKTTSTLSSGPVLVLLLLTCVFGPFFIIYLLSFITPLYHVRYMFTYSPAFYVVLAAGFVGLAARFRPLVAGMAFILLLGASIFSLYQFHGDSRYQADDFRGAVQFIEQRRQPGDVVLVNAGYVYTAYMYYAADSALQRDRLVPYIAADSQRPRLLQSGTVNGSPQLGWGDAQSDFYAMSQADAEAALEQVRSQYGRLWLLRAYDTVTDPHAVMRDWLSQYATLFEDQLFAGPSSIRAQGFLLAPPPPDTENAEVLFEDGMVLVGWHVPTQMWQPGDIVPVKLWWSITSRPGSDYKISLKLWTPAGQLAAQGQDVWPGGSLYRATHWPVGEVVYHPVQIVLPAQLTPGQYWLNVELYHPDTVQPLPRLDRVENVVTLGPVQVE